MGISLELWRARVGAFACRSANRTPLAATNSPRFLHGVLLVLIHFLYILTLLVIGNIELNPGPLQLDKCQVCGFEAKSVSHHVQHQQIHEGSFNFRYVCPVFLCHKVFLELSHLRVHICTHEIPNDEAAAAAQADINFAEQSGLKCTLCGKVENCVKHWCDHFLKVHLKSGSESTPCPLFTSCGSTRTFQTVQQLRPHLSQYHPGWTKDYTLPGHPDRRHQNILEQSEVLEEPVVVNEHQEDIYNYGVPNDSDSSDSECSVEQDALGYSDEHVVSYFAKFYAHLQGRLYVPADTVQKISVKLAIISEILQARLEQVVVKNLTDAGLSSKKVSDIVTNILAEDAFYNSHHPSNLEYLTTEHRRKNYYEKHFQYVKPEEHNLKLNPYDRSHTVQYVPIEKTLNVMLNDVSIQREIDRSFEEKPDSDVVRDYTDGLAFKLRQPPTKRIDIMLFQDAFGCPNPLGSAKKKHKIVGVYMTLGNIRPHLRSRLRAKRLVMLVNDETFSASEDALTKIFKKLVSDLKLLEEKGINYKGEQLPVRLQFLLGDNLGQHTIGGFLEGFTAKYFCRYCKYTRSMFLEDQNQEPACFRVGKWRTPQHYERALGKKGAKQSYKGIKRRSIFNKLQHFKVSDPGQPGCLGHDLFLGGVVDCDLAAMIHYFVETKKWFSYELLNNRLKEFTCKGSDSRNKPAQVKTSGKKLGGHAVQNWCLLRLLPFIIGDKISDTADPVWQLYLLLKSICEYATAPAQHLTQIETMRALVQEYMVKRKCLSNKYKPKHHYFSHLADHYLYFGPLIFLWTLGFEHYHKQFKRASRAACNFINILFTLVHGHQLREAYQSTGVMFPEGAVHAETSPLVEESYDERVRSFICSLNLPRDVCTMKKVTYNEVDYKVGDWLLLSSVPEEASLYIGKIKAILYDSAHEYQFILSKYKTEFWIDYGVHRIVKNNPDTSILGLDLNGDNPLPQAVYEFKNRKCVSLKHVLLP